MLDIDNIDHLILKIDNIDTIDNQIDNLDNIDNLNYIDNRDTLYF